jgi:hypothetical protein
MIYKSQSPQDDSSIVPFGKYRGQPVEVMLADSGYVEWILNQPSLVTRLQGQHPAFFNNITVGSPTTEDSPEHNRLQAMFLSENFQDAFIECAIGENPHAVSAALAKEINDEAASRLKASIELAQRDVALSFEKLKEAQKKNAEAARENMRERYRKERAEHNTDEKERFDRETAAISRYHNPPITPIRAFPKYTDWLEGNGAWGSWPNVIKRHCKTLTEAEKHALDDQTLYLSISNSAPTIAVAIRPVVSIVFECSYDLDFHVQWHLKSEGIWEKSDAYANRANTWSQDSIHRRRDDHFRIELKPRMGDDFPSVLRQMKRSNADTLVVGAFESSACTLDQVRQIFGEKRIITFVEIAAVQKREWHSMTACLAPLGLPPASPNLIPESSTELPPDDEWGVEDWQGRPL